jgi:hypothetical protein
MSLPSKNAPPTISPAFASALVYFRPQVLPPSSEAYRCV